MKKLTLNIEPLKGFGELEFGMPPADAALYLGAPDDDEIIEAEDEEDIETLIQHFDDADISLYFESDEDDKFLINIETGNREAKLFGKVVFELSEEEIIKLMKENGYTEVDTEEGDDDEFPDDRRVSFDEAMMDFFFQDGELASVSWGTFLSDDEDELED